MITGENNTYEEAKIQKNVGCNLSPNLFNRYTEEAPKELRYEIEGGIKIEVMLVRILRFADDIGLPVDKYIFINIRSSYVNL